MEKLVRIQFGFPWHEVCSHLPPDILAETRSFVRQHRMYALVVVNACDPLASRLPKYNKLVDGRSLIRYIREVVSIGSGDILEGNVYQLCIAPLRNAELQLERDPAAYYDRQIECRYCGRFAWRQDRDLQLGEPMRGDLDITVSGEVVVSSRFRRLLEQAGLEGLSFRPLRNLETAWQLVVDAQATVAVPNPFLVAKGGECHACGKSRVLAYEDSNGVSLVSGPFDTPRVERTATLLLTNMNGDVAKTDLEFGTLGRIPEGGPVLGPEHFTHPTSRAEWVVSARLARILFHDKIEEFSLQPAEVTDGGASSDRRAHI